MISLVLATMALLAPDDAPGPAPWWRPEVEDSIARASGRREAWEAMLRGTEPDRRKGVEYLMADLPLRDLETLAPEALAANVDLAYRVRDEVAWGRSLPDPVFLDAVLPHASLTETRDLMRAEFHDRYLPLVRDCKMPGEAALKLNAALFRDYKVVYNTRRLRTDQASRESIAQGMATCTGLSIMLVEAARAIGIPARVAGIRSWPGRGGNHTWAEIWDDGWHFVGAAEPDASGLDHAWFAGEAGSAVADEPRNAIWAATFRRTGSHFPLAWDSRARVNAENVTARYAKKAPAPAEPRLMVEVLDEGERVEAEVKALALDSGDVRLEGTSLGPRVDVNRHLSAASSPGERVLVAVRHRDRRAARFATVEGDTVVRVDLGQPIDDDRGPLAALLADRFGEDDARRERARTLLRHVPFPSALREVAWTAYKSSPRHRELREEWADKTVKTPDRTSPYLWRSVGDASAKSRALVIAMHGGGGAPPGVNDRQWHGMFERYYRDHPEAGDYIYLALRAPNDEWNGFYDDAIAPLVERLILQFVLFGDVVTRTGWRSSEPRKAATARS